MLPNQMNRSSIFGTSMLLNAADGQNFGLMEDLGNGSSSNSSITPRFKLDITPPSSIIETPQYNDCTQYSEETSINGSDPERPQKHGFRMRDGNFSFFKEDRLSHASILLSQFRKRREWSIARRNERIRNVVESPATPGANEGSFIPYQDWPDDVANIIRNRCIIRAKKIWARGDKSPLSMQSGGALDATEGPRSWGVSLLSELPFLPRNHSLVVNFPTLKATWMLHAPSSVTPASTRFFLSTLCSDGLLDLWILRRVSAEAPDVVVASYSQSVESFAEEIYGAAERDGALRKGKAVAVRRGHGDARDNHISIEQGTVHASFRETHDDSSVDGTSMTDDGGSENTFESSDQEEGAFGARFRGTTGRGGSQARPSPRYAQRSSTVDTERRVQPPNGSTSDTIVPSSVAVPPVPASQRQSFASGLDAAASSLPPLYPISASESQIDSEERPTSKISGRIRTTRFTSNAAAPFVGALKTFDSTHETAPPGENLAGDNNTRSSFSSGLATPAPAPNQLHRSVLPMPSRILSLVGVQSSPRQPDPAPHHYEMNHSSASPARFAEADPQGYSVENAYSTSGIRARQMAKFHQSSRDPRFSPGKRKRTENDDPSPSLVHLPVDVSSQFSTVSPHFNLRPTLKGASQHLTTWIPNLADSSHFGMPLHPSGQFMRNERNVNTDL
ncbi:hypothetical protein M427DRAFT_253843 [Gonapodya prolifera JEL478]|uniref:Uncharacterized protein n=1 Tax=Gonapodya prolifera (strain JEL478) TaxID=1344416 RepID=A0A139ALW2_GONPJ|nr:hypothetical protein M427DRAFT_253843 [Gonapodya prolifera JEL478]|eukprot:KXS17554.1 hypothetical protein M427DRAFT_253843 [Gonapodya prolifera JEL478]